VDNDRQTAAETLREARQVLADRIRVEAEPRPTQDLAETRRTLEVEIQALEAALKDWDDHLGDVDR
jgi:hypothetical protein